MSLRSENVEKCPGFHGDNSVNHIRCDIVTVSLAENSRAFPLLKFEAARQNHSNLFVGMLMKGNSGSLFKSELDRHEFPAVSQQAASDSETC